MIEFRGMSLPEEMTQRCHEAMPAKLFLQNTIFYRTVLVKKMSGLFWVFLFFWNGLQFLFYWAAVSGAETWTIFLGCLYFVQTKDENMLFLNVHTDTCHQIKENDNDIHLGRVRLFKFIMFYLM